MSIYLGKPVFSELMGIQTAERSIPNILEELQELTELATNVIEISSIQDRILSVAESVFSLHCDLAEKQINLQDKIKATGSNRETFSEFVKLSKYYIQIRNLTDRSLSNIGRMYDYLHFEADAALTHIEQFGPPKYSLDSLRCRLELASSFHDRVDEMLSRQLDKTYDGIEGTESNYLLYLSQDLEMQVKQYGDEYRERDEVLIEKLSNLSVGG